MRVIAHHGLSDNRRAFSVRTAGAQVQIPHGHKNSSLGWLQAIADIRKGALDNHAHCVGQVGLVELPPNILFEDFFAGAEGGVFVFCHFFIRHPDSLHPGRSPG